MAAEANPEHRSWSVSASNSTIKHGRDKSASAGAATQFPAVGERSVRRPSRKVSQAGGSEIPASGESGYGSQELEEEIAS